MSAITVSATLSGAYPLEEVDALVADLAPLLDVQGTPKILLDLRALEMLHPSTTAVLVAVVTQCLENGRFGPTSEVILPRKASVRNAVARLPGFAALKPFVAGQARASLRPSSATECHRFSDEAAGRVVGREVTAALTASCDVDELAAKAIRTCLDELLDNVIHLADTEAGGFAAARGWRKPPRFEVAIADLGIGIRQSLVKNPEYADVTDDIAALRKAAELGVTSTPHRNSGYGLAVTRDLLEKNHGLLVIKSGWAELWLGSEQEEIAADAAFPGTLVGLRARTNRPLNVTEVYRSLLGELDDA